MTDEKFLNRLYMLDALPSTNPSFDSMAEQVFHHTEANEDFDPDWVFDDKRLDLDDDQRLLRFLAETLHPEVVRDRAGVDGDAAKINALLAPDGFEIFPASSMSGRPVFSFRPTTPRQPPNGDFPSSLIAGLSSVIPGLTTSTGIDSMFEAEDFPPPLSGASNKEEKVKNWLRTAQADEKFDHWAGLGRVLVPIMDIEEDLRNGSGYQDRIRDALSKKNITYLGKGLFTTAQQNEPGLTPMRTQPERSQWIEIGAGGFGVVYKARDAELELDFALKVYAPYPGLSQADALVRFKREAGLLFKLRHENIVRVYDAGQLADGRPFIKMEYFDGLNLQKTREQRGFSPNDAILIVGKLAAAVEHAHSRSILHRDIKPSNVLVSPNIDEVRLIDFGVGILVEEAVERARLTKTEQQFGDAFAAPELLENAKTLDPTIDVYSIGSVWFWLLCGKSPKGVAGLDQAIDSLGIDASLREVMRECLQPSAKRITSSVLIQKLRDSWSVMRKGSR